MGPILKLPVARRLRASVRLRAGSRHVPPRRAGAPLPVIITFPGARPLASILPFSTSD
jgi:hypothetical protein